MFTISAKGFVNSLQILAVPGGTIKPDSWASRGPKPEKQSGGQAERMEVDDVLGAGTSDEDDLPEESTPAPVSAAVGPVRTKAKVVPDYVLVAALSKEPRLGRWMTTQEKGVRNGCLVVCLRKEEVEGVLE